MSNIQLKIVWTDSRRPAQKFFFDTINAARSAIAGIALKFTDIEMCFNEEDDLSGGPMVFPIGSIATITVSEVDSMMDVLGPDEEEGDVVYHYVLMRTDVPDWLAGKAAAQVNHAGTKMVLDAIRKNDPVQMEALTEWEQQGGGFGTCIVLGVTAAEMRQALSLASLLGIHAGLVHDPSYPLRDGDRIATLPVDTCVYMLGRKSECRPVVGRLPLLRSPLEN